MVAKFGTRGCSKNAQKSTSQLIKFYISGRMFRVREEEYSEVKHITAGVPQSSALGIIIYLIYTGDIPKSDSTTIATIAGNTTVLAVGNNEETTPKF